MPSARVDLVIFDCDGVLVDSEIISCRVHAETLTRHGYPISAEQVAARFLGRSGREARREIEAELGRAFSDDLEVELKDELYRSFAATLQPITFIAEALDAIAQPVCVASSGSQERIKIALTRVGLYERFAPHLFSAEHVRHGKPAPDLFLFAAEQMHVAPARCVVIEDSVPGVIGAAAAGMTVLGYHGGSHCQPDTAAALRAAGAAASFDDMRQLPAMIEQIQREPA
ncbi:MAG: HAD family hydrolase [Rhodopseudomonas sp.]|uniref:HAD family hydrolase n=1 Tax=Rhodopseudomonas sp. TaxID=1078 RepID=UPI0017C86FD7|nr:HAD family hydrolase [Rhodopseudomonas sp.]NVN85635.1 HAD family hydrolase [Rhodopseudomonas sp.]